MGYRDRERPATLKEVPFMANGTMWAYRVLKYRNGNVVVALERAGKSGISRVSFNVLELPNVLSALGKLKVPLK